MENHLYDNGSYSEIKPGCNVVATKVNQIDPNERKKIVDKFKEQFEDPAKYLTIDHNIIIGKRINHNKSHDEKPVNANKIRNLLHIPFSAVNKVPEYKRGNSKTSRLTTAIGSPKIKPFSSFIRSNYEVISEDKLEKIFIDAKARVSESKERDIVINSVDPESKRSFDKQDKLFCKSGRDFLKSARLSKELSHRVNKNEDELLMNRIDAFRVKKQIKEKIENNKTFEERYGHNAWMLGLRREKKPKSMRVNYVNVGSNTNPIWKQLIEYPPRNVEIIQRPNSHYQHDMKFLSKNEYFKSACKKIKFDLNKLPEMNQIAIEGKNLLEEEYNKATARSGKKRLYKAPTNEADVKEEVLKQMYFNSENNFRIKSTK